MIAAPQNPTLELASAVNKNPRYINSSVNGAPITKTGTLSQSQLELRSVADRMEPVGLSRKDSKFCDRNLTGTMTE
jgi:hypothetical protein